MNSLLQEKQQPVELEETIQNRGLEFYGNSKKISNFMQRGRGNTQGPEAIQKVSDTRKKTRTGLQANSAIGRKETLTSTVNHAIFILRLQKRHPPGL